MNTRQKIRNLSVVFFCLSVILVLTACSQNTTSPSITPPTAASPSTSLSPSTSPTPNIPVYTYKIMKVFPHDKTAFTEGLIFDGGVLYESTGLYGRSSLRRVELETGKVLQSYKLEDKYFAEGITVIQDRIIQLTWQTHTGFVYDKNSFAILDQFSYTGEGWGLTYNGQRLIMSDGTSTLRFLNPQTFQSEVNVQVRDQGRPVNNLNELEYINGQIYANVWQTNRIAIINPQNGQVTAWLDLTGLLQTQNYSGKVDVLNGIAYDSQSNRLFVTGKYWPYLFQIDLVK